jgi:hypothetical protein
MGKAAQYQFLIRVTGWPGYFVSRTGGDNQANVQKVYDGGAMTPDVMAGRRTTNNLVVQRHFDPDRDGPIVSQYGPLVGRYRTTVSVQPTDEDLVPVGPARVYPDAMLNRLAEPGANANSDDPSTWEAEFAVAQVV